MSKITSCDKSLVSYPRFFDVLLSLFLLLLNECYISNELPLAGLSYPKKSGHQVLEIITARRNNIYFGIVFERDAKRHQQTVLLAGC